MMKHVNRSIIGHALMAPFMVGVMLLSLMMGRAKAVRIVGKLLTVAAKKFVDLAIPAIDSPDQFDGFRKKVKKNYAMYRILYDIKVTEENADTIQFSIHHCPFSKTLHRYGFYDLSKYACAADWLIAKENNDKWLFSRDHTIGTGGMFCNPRYSRKIKQRPSGN
jgi:hypothetical protein